MGIEIVRLEDVSKTYYTGKTTVEALKKASLSVDTGDFITISGPSGSGKSTLLNLMGLLDAPSSGIIHILGNPILVHDFSKLADIRSHSFSFIFQTFNLIPVLSVEENIMIPLYIRKDINRAEKRRRVEEWIEKVGLTSHRTHKPDELSGGQRQRVAIARAMVTYPELVYADEPSANLDSHTASSILNLMKELNQFKGTAFVFSTHDPTIRSFARIRYKIIDGILEREQ